MLILKHQCFKNWFSFFLLVVVVIWNSLFSIKKFRVIEMFNEIQIKLRLFTDSFVMVFITTVQLIAVITVVIIETLFITFIANFVTKKKLKFSDYLFPIFLANIISILINMAIINVTNVDDFEKIKWLGWSPVSQIVLAIIIYYFMTFVNKSLTTKIKIKVVTIIFLVAYGLPLIVIMLSSLF